MESMRSRLDEAAIEGNVSLLQELLQQDPLLLDMSNLTGPCRNPLHVAALLGHADFARHILQLKPRLAYKMDSQGFSPLHFAAANGHLEIVRQLLQIDPEVCSLHDADRRNPLHLAAINGHVRALEEMIKVRPEAARATVDHGRTILHLCVSNNQLESLKLLIQAIADTIFLNAKDHYGFTILHLAVSNKQLETVEFLVKSEGMEVNAVNSTGFTPLDILVLQSNRDAKDLDIAELLRAFGAQRTTTVSAAQNRNPDGSIVGWGDGKGHWLSSERDALMVVASVLATMAFQAGTNPPGGAWQDNKEGQVAGESIMASKSFYYFSNFIQYVTVGFGLSLITLYGLLISRGADALLRYRVVFYLLLGGAFSAIAFGYWYSIQSLTPQSVMARVRPQLMTQLVIYYGIIVVVVLICSRKSVKSTVRKLISRLRR